MLDTLGRTKSKCDSFVVSTEWWWKELNIGWKFSILTYHHSHPQRLRSFLSAPSTPWISTSGLVQHWKSAIHGLPITLCMLRVIRLWNLIAWEYKTIILHMLRKLDLHRGQDSWCWPNGEWPWLGTRTRSQTKCQHLCVYLPSWGDIASYVKLNPENTLLSDNSLTWMAFPTEYTGLGMFWPQSLNGDLPSFDATLVINTRAPWLFVQSVFWFGSSVKLWKVSRIICPTGTVIFQAQSSFWLKFPGKPTLVRNPIDPLSASPHATNKIHIKNDWGLLDLVLE